MDEMIDREWGMYLDLLCFAVWFRLETGWSLAQMGFVTCMLGRDGRCTIGDYAI